MFVRTQVDPPLVAGPAAFLELLCVMQDSTLSRAQNLDAVEYVCGCRAVTEALFQRGLVPILDASNRTALIPNRAIAIVRVQSLAIGCAAIAIYCDD